MMIPDGTLLGDGTGKLWSAFCPPWWRVDRWVAWWWCTRIRKAPHGRITFWEPGSFGVQTSLRVVETSVRLPNVPGQGAESFEQDEAGRQVG